MLVAPGARALEISRRAPWSARPHGRAFNGFTSRPVEIGHATVSMPSKPVSPNLSRRGFVSGARSGVDVAFLEFSLA